MANKSLEIMDLKQLLRLKVAGKSNRKIGEIIGRYILTELSTEY